MTWIQTHSGRAFDYRALANGQHVPILMNDIAHGLSNLGRFCGQASRFYSVAEHSCVVRARVKQLGGSPVEEAQALIHDATEAYLTDLPSPLKRMPEMWWYRLLENELQKKIFVQFGLEPTMARVVHQADKDVLELERSVLLGKGDRPWDIYSTTPAYGLDIVGLYPEHAEKRFLRECKEVDVLLWP